MRHNRPPHLEYLVLSSPAFLASFSEVCVEEGQQVAPALRGLPEPSGSYWAPSILRKGTILFCLPNALHIVPDRRTGLINASLNQWHWLEVHSGTTLYWDLLCNLARKTTTLSCSELALRKPCIFVFRDTAIQQILNTRNDISRRKEHSSPSFSKGCLFSSDIFLAANKTFSHLIFSSDSNSHCDGKTATTNKLMLESYHVMPGLFLTISWTELCKYERKTMSIFADLLKPVGCHIAFICWLLEALWLVSVESQ